MGNVFVRQNFLGHLPQNALAGRAKRIVAVGDQPAEQADRVGFEDRRPAGRTRSRRSRRPCSGRCRAAIAARRSLAEIGRRARPRFLARPREAAVRGGSSRALPTAAALPFHRRPRALRTSGKRCDEALEVVADRGHLRLLQHDLADPDAVRIARLAPGQIAGVFGVPGQQPAAERLLLGGGETWRRALPCRFAIRRGGHAESFSRKGAEAQREQHVIRRLLRAFAPLRET